MKNPNHRDRLIASLPAGLQAGAMEACHNISEDGNDPVVGMFAVDVESTQRGFADQRETTERSTAQLREEIRSLREKLADSDNQLRAKLAESEEREKQLPAHITKEVSKLGEDKFWKRVFLSKFAGGLVSGITFSIGLVAGAYWLINSQNQAIREGVDAFKADQTKTLAKISDNPQGIVDYAKASMKAADKSNDTAAMLAGIAAMLKTPDAYIGMRDGQLTVRIKSEHITIKQEEEYTYLRIHEEMPPILDRIEDNLNDADKALQKPK